MRFDPEQVVYEQHIEQHGGTRLSRTLAYTPERDFIFETKGELDNEAGFRIIFDAGDRVKSEKFSDRVKDRQEYSRPEPYSAHIGAETPKDADWVELKGCIFDEEELNIQLEDINGDRRCKLYVEGDYADVSNMEETVAEYACELCEHDVDPYTDYMEDSNSPITPENVLEWKQKTWEDIIERSFDQSARLRH